MYVMWSEDHTLTEVEWLRGGMIGPHPNCGRKNRAHLHSLVQEKQEVNLSQNITVRGPVENIKNWAWHRENTQKLLITNELPFYHYGGRTKQNMVTVW